MLLSEEPAFKDALVGLWDYLVRLLRANFILKGFVSVGCSLPQLQLGEAVLVRTHLLAARVAVDVLLGGSVSEAIEL